MILISPDGVILLSRYGKHIGDHLDIDSVTAAVPPPARKTAN